MNRAKLLKVLAAIAVAGVLVMAAITGASWWKERGQVASRPLGSIGGGPTSLCPLGWYQPDPNTSQCSTAFGFTPSLPDASTPVFTIQGLTPGDDDFVAVLVKVQAPGSTDYTGRASFRYKWSLTYPADGSSFADPTGATTPTLVDSQVGSGVAGTTVSLVQSGSSLQVTTNCQTASACVSSGSVDWFRNQAAPWVTAVSPSSAFAGTASPVLLTLTTTPGATNGITGGGCVVPRAYAGAPTLTACPAGSYALTGCIQQSQTTATCFLPAGSYTAGVDSVCLLSSAAPFCLASGLTLDASGPDTAVPDTGVDSSDSAVADSGTDAADASDSGSDAADAADAADAGPPTVASIIPNWGTAAGGRSVTVAYGNCTTVGAVKINGAALTSLSCGAGTCTGVTPSYAGGNLGSGATGYGVEVDCTSSGQNTTGTASAPTAYWYSPSVLTVIYEYQADTNAGATTTSWVDQAGNQNWASSTAPGVSSGFNAGSLKYVSFDGGNTMTNTWASPQSSGYSDCEVIQVSATTHEGLMQYIATGSGKMATYAGATTTLYGSDTVSGAAAYGTLTTSPIVICKAVPSSGATLTWINGTAGAGGTPILYASQGGGVNVLGSAPNASETYVGKVASMVAYANTIDGGTGSTEPQLTAMFRAIYGF